MRYNVPVFCLCYACYSFTLVCADVAKGLNVLMVNEQIHSPSNGSTTKCKSLTRPISFCYYAERQNSVNRHEKNS